MATPVTTALLLRPLWDHFTTGSMSEAFTFTLASYILKPCALAYWSWKCGSEKNGESMHMWPRQVGENNVKSRSLLLSCDRQTLRTKPPAHVVLDV